jgi:hypothetical protein
MTWNDSTSWSWEVSWPIINYQADYMVYSGMSGFHLAMWFFLTLAAAIPLFYIGFVKDWIGEDIMPTWMDLEIKRRKKA